MFDPGKCVIVHYLYFLINLQLQMFDQRKLWDITLFMANNFPVMIACSYKYIS